ncbi:Crp/Fnr family transcriptional regulator [Sulfuricaulis limicola]|uniref:Crp/Fnr family transcriptional regulator n=1 Tax=Sulfuricaulis limicola TaxID=1620215 RepID=A0A1B4XJP0_9GAMM|nr:Crp/Fnr family transcriptional regulator [Sulfuricaulis limicola]BAV35014.1 Crp/Fnr family transcriptional regulator [Sulfuricaulis limicola]
MTRKRRGGRSEACAGASCGTSPPTGKRDPLPRTYGINDCEYCEAKLYAGLSARQVSELRGRLGSSHSGPREILFRAGDPSKYLYVVREGQLKLTRTDITGHVHLLNLVGPGYFLGFDDVGNATHSYSAETLTPTVFCRIKHDDIAWLLAQAPQVSLNILLAVNEQLAQARNMIRALGQKTAMEKVAALLLSLYPPGAAGGSGKAGALHLSRQEMAEILGLTVETVSRIMAGLRRKGIINAPRGRIVVSVRPRLQALAGDPPRATSSRKKYRSRRQGRVAA